MSIDAGAASKSVRSVSCQSGGWSERESDVCGFQLGLSTRQGVAGATTVEYHQITDRETDRRLRGSSPLACYAVAAAIAPFVRSLAHLPISSSTPFSACSLALSTPLSHTLALSASLPPSLPPSLSLSFARGRVRLRGGGGSFCAMQRSACRRSAASRRIIQSKKSERASKILLALLAFCSLADSARYSVAPARGLNARHSPHHPPPSPYPLLLSPFPHLLFSPVLTFPFRSPLSSPPI